jgi:hypothetical protein
MHQSNHDWDAFIPAEPPPGPQFWGSMSMREIFFMFPQNWGLGGLDVMQKPSIGCEP